MVVNELSVRIGGFAGQGINTVALALARLCSRAGLDVFVNLEYPSNIKGEHNYAQVVVSEKPVGSQTRQTDLLLAVDAKTIVMHLRDIAAGGVLIYDSAALEVSPVDVGLKIDKIDRDDIGVIDLPLLQLAKDAGGDKRMVNMIGLGAVLGLVQLGFEELVSLVREQLARLGEDVIRRNLEAARRAYDLTSGSHAAAFGHRLKRRASAERMLLTGNDAIALGAIKAGVGFYAGYPMTPASAVQRFITSKAREMGIVTVLPEDEISAIGMAMGASHAGVRAMTGTSGGGFALMTEHVGLAGIAEVPLVILEGQRPGPATGLPTRTEQGDLHFALHAGQGDFGRIVLAPGDVEEAFRLTHEAFNLADRYQTPVVVLSDKHLGECYWTQEPFDTSGMQIDRGELLSERDLKDTEYRRFRLTDSGISPRVLPGTPGGVHRITGNEHNEFGLTTEDADMRARQTAKRLRKTASLNVSSCGCKVHGDTEADLTLVGWGSTKPVIMDVMRELRENHGIRSRFLQVIFMEPFPVDTVRHVLEKSKTTVLIENNATGQLGELICQRTGVAIARRVLKYDGRQFLRDELIAMIQESIGAGKEVVR